MAGVTNPRTLVYLLVLSSLPMIMRRNTGLPPPSHTATSSHCICMPFEPNGYRLFVLVLEKNVKLNDAMRAACRYIIRAGNDILCAGTGNDLTTTIPMQALIV